MAAISIPGQPKRWGNESTNFYQASYAPSPGLPSKDKDYRCTNSQYTHSGHYHVGTKAINQGAPLDTYGTASARKLRPEDQRLPKPLFTGTVQSRQLSRDRPVNMYQSHHQRYHSYAMSRPPLKRSLSEEQGGTETLARSLNKAFYVTSYQTDIARHAGKGPTTSYTSGSEHHSLASTGDQTLRQNLVVRRNSITADTPPALPVRRARITSAPPLRSALPTEQVNSTPVLQRRRSFTALKQTYPSKGEMLKDIFTAFPAPQPQAASRRQSRPSSAVTLRAGKIPSLRKTNTWI